MASRYVAALDKLERNYSGEELTAQRAKLEEQGGGGAVYSAAHGGGSYFLHRRPPWA